MIPLKYLSSFWRTLEISLINCEINLILTWSEKCVLSNDTKATTFVITNTKRHVPVVTLSIQDNAKLLEQLKLDFKRTNKWNKYEPKLSFENKDGRTVHTKYYLPTVEIKDYNAIIDGKNFFDQPVKNSLRTYDNINKIATGQGDDYTTGCLLDYKYFNNYYEMISIDLSKQQALDVYPKAIQQVNFTVNLAWEGNANTIMFFNTEEVKELFWFFQKELLKYCNFILF